jgi:hypothetical protein
MASGVSSVQRSAVADGLDGDSRSFGADRALGVLASTVAKASAHGAYGKRPTKVRGL